MASDSVLLAGGVPRDTTAGQLHGARVHAAADVARPGHAAVGAARLPDDWCERDARDALDRIRGLRAALQRGLDGGAVSHTAPAGKLALEPAGIRRCGSRSGVQYGRLLYDQYELAGVRR